MPSYQPELPLTADERSRLRKARLKISQIHTLGIKEISQHLNISDQRARKIKGWADFQLVPSVGFGLADKLVRYLQIYRLEDIKNENPAQLFDLLEKEMGVRTDGCVEDQIRCVIHFANNKKIPKKRFDFTDERKAYRVTNGFPSDRPEKSWRD